MSTVEQIMKEKQREVWSISSQATVYEALEILAEKNVGALLVLDNEKIVGVLSERDCVRKVELKGKTSKDTLVKDIMSTTITTVQRNTKIGECMKLITEKYIRHLPVLEGDKLVGIVTIGDIVRKMISEMDSTINSLSDYISGKG